MHEARRSVANLRPLPLDGSSLLEALERKVIEFKAETATKTYGLSSMHERARLVGGWVTLQSKLGEGCRIRVIVPYLKAREWEAGRTEARGIEQVRV